MLVHHTSPDASQALDTPVPCPANALTPAQRQRLALGVLTGSATLSQLARQHQVSRKFIAQAVAIARPINDRQDLSRVRIGADNEIFQAGRPVLVGVDTESSIATC